MTINILGTKYFINYELPSENKILQICDSYCDKKEKRITVTNYAQYQKQLVRYEIIRAFMQESKFSLENEKYKNEEEFADWLSIQFQHLLETFKKVDAL